MEPLGIATIIASIIGAVASIASTAGDVGSTIKTNNDNLANMDKINSMNSVASKVAEYEKSGINKQLVSGIQPNYTLSALAKAPSFAGLEGLGNIAGKAVDSYRSNLEYENNRLHLLAQNKKLEAEIAESKVRKDIADEELRLKKHDVDILTRRVNASTDPVSIRTVTSAIDTVNGLWNNGDNPVMNFFNQQEQKTQEFLEKQIEKKMERDRQAGAKRAQTASPKAVESAAMARIRAGVESAIQADLEKWKKTNYAEYEKRISNMNAYYASWYSDAGLY